MRSPVLCSSSCRSLRTAAVISPASSGRAKPSLDQVMPRAAIATAVLLSAAPAVAADTLDGNRIDWRLDRALLPLVAVKENHQVQLLCGGTELFVEMPGDVVGGQHLAAEHLDHRPDLVVVGNAVTRDNPEAAAMRAMGLAYCSMPEALNHFAAADKETLLVAGTHGKTTTSSLLA